MSKYWHYTTDGGAEAIMASKRINASVDSSRDAAFGHGVYVTTIKPTRRTVKIAKNNWDGGFQGAIDGAYLDKAIGFKLTAKGKGKIRKCQNTAGRDIYLYEDKDGLDLGDADLVEDGSVEVFDRIPQRERHAAKAGK